MAGDDEEDSGNTRSPWGGCYPSLCKNCESVDVGTRREGGQATQARAVGSQRCERKRGKRNDRLHPNGWVMSMLHGTELANVGERRHKHCRTYSATQIMARQGYPHGRRNSEMV